LLEIGSSDETKKMFDDKIIAPVKFHATTCGALPAVFRKFAKRNILNCQIAFKMLNYFCSPITLEIWLVMSFLQSIHYSMHYRSTRVLWLPNGMFLSTNFEIFSSYHIVIFTLNKWTKLFNINLNLFSFPS